MPTGITPAGKQYGAQGFNATPGIFESHNFNCSTSNASFRIFCFIFKRSTFIIQNAFMLKFSYQQNRIFGLDILRAIAIIFVVYPHSYACLHNPAISFSLFALPVLLDGVTVFFVLSGFLIGLMLIRLLESNPTASFRQLFIFWKNRWLMILPNYYVVLFFVLIYYSLFTTYPVTFTTTCKFIFFITGFFSAPGNLFLESWTLNVEMWFYLLFPCLLVATIFWTKKNLKRAFLFTIFFFLIAPFLLRVGYFLQQAGFDDVKNYYRTTTILRFDAIAYGALGAYMYHYYYSTWIRYKKTLLAIAIIVLITLKIAFLYKEPSNFYSAVMRHSILPALVLLALPFLSVFNPVKKSFFHTLITHLSVISYAMYLLNLTPVLLILLPALENKFHLFSTGNTALKMFLFWALTIAGSYLLYILVQKPMMDLRKKRILLFNNN